MGLSERNADAERRALTESALGGNRAAVQPHEFLDQREPDA
jgi:hypothetical protein